MLCTCGMVPYLFTSTDR